MAVIPLILVLIVLLPASAARAQAPGADALVQSARSDALPAFETPAGNDQKPPENDRRGDQGQNETGDQNQTAGTSNDRLFWTLPNFLTVENMEHVPPMNGRQKFAVIARTSFDLVEIPWYASLAAIGQAQNNQPEFGQGASGYVKRLGTAFADGTIDNFMVGAVFPAMLHQDPRYYQLGRGGVWHRTGYSLSRLLITRGDSGRREFNYSEVLGSAATAALSNIYHSPSDRTAANSIAVWWTQIGYDAIAIVVKEFWPDIRRKLSGAN